MIMVIILLQPLHRDRSPKPTDVAVCIDGLTIVLCASHYFDFYEKSYKRYCKLSYKIALDFWAYF